MAGGCTEHVGKSHIISMFPSPSSLCGLFVIDWRLALHTSPMKYELSSYLGVQEFLYDFSFMSVTVIFWKEKN